MSSPVRITIDRGALPSLAEMRAETERAYWTAVRELAGGNASEAARLARCSRATAGLALAKLGAAKQERKAKR